MARIELKMPELGNEITEAQVDLWHKAAGDEVSEGEEILRLRRPRVGSLPKSSWAKTSLPMLGRF